MTLSKIEIKPICHFVDRHSTECQSAKRQGTLNLTRAKQTLVKRQKLAQT
jgi:hypothetical protein